MSNTSSIVKTLIQDHFDGSYYIDAFEKRVLTNYLFEVEKSAVRSVSTYASILKKFLESIQQHPVLIKKTDMIEYLKEFDAKNYSDSYNKSTRSVLSKFLQYLDDACDMEGIPFKNPMPGSATCKFTRKEIRSRQSRVQRIFTREQIEKLLDHAYKCNRRDYVLFLLLARTGMRIEECLSIRIEDIHFDERYLLTGIEQTCQKSSRYLGSALEVVFSPEVAAMLQDYVAFLNRESGFLFASHGDKGFLSQTCIRRRLINIYRKIVGVKFTCHWFRHTLITARKMTFDGENGTIKIADWESEIIMNHIPTSVENKVYLEKPVEFKRDLYDRYDPFKNLI